MINKIIKFSKRDGRLKRIEYRGKYLRASRTGGVSLRAQGKAIGINFTINSNHGIRASKQIWHGTNIGFQNSHFFFRGRYGKGPTKLNVSKSGFSLSTKTGWGTINWSKPKYSSAKLFGVQFRGQKAFDANAIFLFIQSVFILIQLLYFFLTKLFSLTLWSINFVSSIPAFTLSKIEEYRLNRKQRFLQELEINWHKKWENQPIENLVCAQLYTLLLLGRGKSKTSKQFIKKSLIGYDGIKILEPIIVEISDKIFEDSIRLVHESLHDRTIEHLLLLKLFFGSLVYEMSKKVKTDIIWNLFWAMDYAILKDTKRNQLQEELLYVFAKTCGLRSTENVKKENAGIDSNPNSSLIRNSASPDHESIKESIIQLLKDKPIKMTTSDINAHLRHNDLEEIKAFCKQLYEYNEISFAGSGRYFILNDETKDSEDKKVDKVASSSIDPAEEIRKYGKLRDEGLITEEEFVVKKKQILGL